MDNEFICLFITECLLLDRPELKTESKIGGKWTKEQLKSLSELLKRNIIPTKQLSLSCDERRKEEKILMK